MRRMLSLKFYGKEVTGFPTRAGLWFWLRMVGHGFDMTLEKELSGSRTSRTGRVGVQLGVECLCGRAPRGRGGSRAVRLPRADAESLMGEDGESRRTSRGSSLGGRQGPCSESR